MLEGSTYNPRWTGDPIKYIDGKLAIITDPRAFGVKPTPEDIAHLKTLKTQVAIDNAILDLVFNHLK